MTDWCAVCVFWTRHRSLRSILCRCLLTLFVSSNLFSFKYYKPRAFASKSVVMSTSLCHDLTLVALGIGVKYGKESYSRSKAIEAFNGSSHHRSSWFTCYWLEASNWGHTSVCLWWCSSSQDCGYGSHLRDVSIAGHAGQSDSDLNDQRSSIVFAWCSRPFS